jgi:hypothetical protein
MWKSRFLFFFSIMSFFACTKSNEVHFYGRISVDCNNQGVPNVSITIQRVFDTGMHDYSTVGYAITDMNGNYSVIEDVKQEGGFMYYAISVHNAPGSIPKIDAEVTSGNNSGNVEINYQSFEKKHFSFHVKNTNSFNGADHFNFLSINRYPDLSRYDTLFRNLHGSNVDTVINSTLFYQVTNCIYSFTKNNQTTSIDTAISHPGCSDTLKLDIFY